MTDSQKVPKVAQSDIRTLDFYDQNSKIYAARQPHREDIEALEYFMSELSEGSDICDLGCGNGWAAAKLIENGFRVKAIDGSAGLATQAKRIHGLKVEVSKFEEFSYRSTFDGLWACWTLHHTSRGVFPKLLQTISESVRPGGILFFSVKGGGGEKRDTFDRLYSYHEWSDLSDVIGEVVNGQIISHASWSEKCFEGYQTPLHQVFIRMNN